MKTYIHISRTIDQDSMQLIEREVESTKVKVTITPTYGIELHVIPSTGAFVAEKSIGRLFQMRCENKDLCACSSAGLNDPKILEAMLKFAPISVEYNHSVVKVKYSSSFFGVDTSLCLFAFRMRKPKPRGPDELA